MNSKSFRLILDSNESLKVRILMQFYEEFGLFNHPLVAVKKRYICDLLLSYYSINVDLLNSYLHDPMFT